MSVDGVFVYLVFDCVLDSSAEDNIVIRCKGSNQQGIEGISGGGRQSGSLRSGSPQSRAHPLIVLGQSGSLLSGAYTFGSQMLDLVTHSLDWDTVWEPTVWTGSLQSGIRFRSNISLLCICFCV